ncbi:hypothetical protein Lalb_Chr18g0049091 [Lupinus albus]|uniref:Uncharacterized protein n=1 Tax=Lupinus albus TaxID=3870 RepID=A0A6A4P351_LUPAL|nr:hypothetical protein Lalb_Chr18g0049091 [Lupinus albus]
MKYLCLASLPIIYIHSSPSDCRGINSLFLYLITIILFLKNHMNWVYLVTIRNQVNHPNILAF